MDEATKLLIELRQTVRCIHLDMGGKNKYMLTIHSQSVMQKINDYLTRVADVEKCPHCDHSPCLGQIEADDCISI